jgi:hypothetical protein
MAKRWILDSDTKGTGARMVPLDEAAEKRESKGPTIVPERKPADRKPTAASRPSSGGQTRITPLAPGQVRKKSTGEIGKVKAIDAKAGTATVTWLRDGRTSTVPISSVTRK